MGNLRNSFILDDASSWPKQIVQIIKEGKGDLRRYFEEARRIDKLLESTPELWYITPRNKFESRWSEVVQKLEGQLFNTNIVGFHCTRLMDYEMDDVLQRGLMPLSVELAHSRIARMFTAGLIKDEAYRVLIGKRELSDPYRKDRIFLFHCTSTLKDEFGLYRLFNSWGGEALYINYEDRGILKGLGTPCIVVVSVPISRLPDHINWAERMIAIQLKDSYIHHCMDSWTSDGLPIRALTVINEINPLFNKLTNRDKWTMI